MAKRYLKSPLNYVGGKFKILDQILPLFPDKINTFIDMFGGGYNVGINVKANTHIYNDIDKATVNLQEWFYTTDTDDIITEIESIVRDYQLSDTNAEGFNALRDYYNEGHTDPGIFYVLICHSFNNQMRFNKKGKYNMTFGKRTFNVALREKLITYVEALKRQNIVFGNHYFDEYRYVNSDSFVYCDPPYLNSTAVYNETWRLNGGWTIRDELNLIDILNDYNDRGIKFALSNNLKYSNDDLEGWIRNNRYTIHYLNADYSGCSYNKIDRSKDIEVLITNY